MILIERFQDQEGLDMALALGEQYGHENEPQDENQHHCILRERGNEIEVALSLHVPVLVQTVNERVNILMLSKSSKIHDRKQIKRLCGEKTALLRHYPYRTETETCLQIDKTLKKKLPTQKGHLLSLADIGCRNIVSEEEDKKVSRWPDHVNKKYTGREIRHYSLPHLLVIKDFFGDIGFVGPDGFEVHYPVFVKTCEKGYSQVIRHKRDFSHMGIHGMHQDCFVAEYIDIAEDDLGKKEFRVYVVGSNAINAARIPLDYEEGKIPDGLMNFAQAFAYDHSQYFQSYVVDIAVLKDGKFAVVELNNLARSGRYFGNNFTPILRACMGV